jgi:prophage regulatory protein
MRVIRLKGVQEKTGLKHSAIYERMRRGTFPKQVRLGPKSVGWIATLRSNTVTAYLS